jgi:hypothetical protein
MKRQLTRLGKASYSRRHPLDLHGWETSMSGKAFLKTRNVLRKHLLFRKLTIGDQDFVAAMLEATCNGTF